VWADWTDARNGRSSGGQGGDTVAPSEPGRNPLCEQSDIFADTFNINTHDEGKKAKDGKDADAFLVALCPPAAQDKESVKK
jgi:hypothetical protein